MAALRLVTPGQISPHVHQIVGGVSKNLICLGARTDYWLPFRMRAPIVTNALRQYGLTMC